MKTIMILAAGNVVAGGIVGLIDVFSFTNALYRRLHPEATQDLFHCHIVSGDGQAITTNQGFQLAATGLSEAAQLEAADAVVLASSFVTNKAEFKEYSQGFAPLLGPLKAYAETGKPIAAYCSGTLMLAASGLLDNRRATTVWWLSQMFERNFARVNLCMDSLVVSDGQFHTAGATTSNLSLALHLVGLLAGEALAQQIDRKSVV